MLLLATGAPMCVWGLVLTAGYGFLKLPVASAAVAAVWVEKRDGPLSGISMKEEY